MVGTITLKHDFTINQISDEVNTLRNLMEEWKEVIKQWDGLIVDAKDVKNIDIAGIQAIIAAQKECESKGCKIILEKSQAVANLMSVIGIGL